MLPIGGAPAPQKSPFTPTDGPSAYCAVIDSVVDVCIAASEQHREKDTLDSLEQLEAAGRSDVCTKLTLAGRITPLISGKRCRYCSHPRCICELLPRPRTLRHRLWVWMHHSDLFRASNSGKLLAATCPDARLAVAGLSETETELMHLVAECRPTTCVLYPAETSRMTAEYVEYLAASCPASPHEGDSAGAGRPLPLLDIIVIDGTWSTVKSMVRRLPPGLNFLRVNLSCAKSLFRARTQGPERESLGFTSTLEACAALLDELGEPAQVSAALRDSFKLNDDTVLLCKRGLSMQAYGSWLKQPNGELVPIATRVGGYLD
jgi:DTW domain-containing protein YfiP